MDQEFWDIFAQPPPPSATNMRDWIQTQTEPTSLATDAAPFRQTQPGVIRLITRDLDQWMDLSRAKLQVRFRLADPAAGAALDPATAITLANGGFGLFENMTLYANGKEIDRIDNCHKVHLMHGYTSYSNSYIEQVAESEWFYRPSSTITAGGLDGADADPGGNQAGVRRRFTGFANANDPTKFLGDTAATRAPYYGILAKRNDSFAARFAKTQGSKEVEIWLPLSAVSGFCREVKKAIRGITFQVDLNRNVDFASILHGQNLNLGTTAAEAALADNVSAFALVNYVSLWIPVCKPTLEMASRIETQMAENAKTQWIYTNSKVYVSDEYNQTSTRWLITSESSRPLLAVVGFQHRKQYAQIRDAQPLVIGNAGATANALGTDAQPRGTQRPQLASAAPDLFSPLANITKVEMRINGYIVPTESYQLDFLNDRFKRAYQDFLAVYGKDEPDSSAKVFDEFVYRDSPLFAFDLRAYGDTQLYDQIKTNNIEVRCQVETSADGNLAQGLYGSGPYQIYCMLVVEKTANLEARGGRLSIMP